MSIKCDRPGTLVSRARHYLNSDTRSMLDIHKLSGLPLYWLKDFKSGRIKAPSVNRVQALYEFYTESKLELV